MAATATLQTAWNCRWSRPGHRITGLAEAVQPESVWVCVRENGRRSVCDAECASCSSWEAIASTGGPAAIFPASHRVIAEAPVFAVPVPIPQDAVAQVAFRAVLVVIAVVFAALGVAVLTRPLAIPFTVVLWLCAAASLGIAAFGRFELRR